MIDYKQLWCPHTIARGQTLELCLGLLTVWIHRGKQEWYIAHETNGHDSERYSVSSSEIDFSDDRDWTRWILDERVEQVQFRPQLPDRSVIVRPEVPMCLMPKQSVQFFIGIPLWLTLSFGAKHEKVIEIPSTILSNSWFGSFTEGELCYALRTTAKMQQENLLPSANRIIFPLEIRNQSQEKLNFERLCVRPQFLNVFQGASRLWTSKGRVSYRGEESWSRIVYTTGAPEFDGRESLVGKAREPMRHGAFLKTFDTLKQRVEIL